MKPADFARCRGINCPKKKTCLRHTSPPHGKGHRQVWIMVPNPRECTHYVRDLSCRGTRNLLAGLLEKLAAWLSPDDQ